MEIPTKRSKIVETDMNFKADRNFNVENVEDAILCLYSRSYICNTVCQLPVCVKYMCGAKTIMWKAYAAMHIMQFRQPDKTSHTVSADRETDLGTAVYAYICGYSICSTVKYIREYIQYVYTLTVFILWRELEKWRRQRQL